MRRGTLLTLLTLLTVLVGTCGAAIDAGPGATNRASTANADFTLIDMANRANGTGTLDTVEIWAATDLTGCKVGTFYRTSANTFQCRASANLGNVTAGSKQTFGTLSVSVTQGDFLGVYFATGTLERDTTGGQGFMYVSGEYADATDSAGYTFLDDDAVSIYATGTGTEVSFFGKQTRGASAGSLAANTIRGSSGTPASNGSVTRISVYVVSGWAAGENVRCALYNAGMLAYLGETGALSAGGAGWFDFDFASPVAVTSGTSYLIALWGDATFTVSYDAATGEAYPQDATGTYPTWPDPVASATGYQYAAYATYTPSATPSVIVPISFRRRSQ